MMQYEQNVKYAEMREKSFTQHIYSGSPKNHGLHPLPTIGEIFHYFQIARVFFRQPLQADSEYSFQRLLQAAFHHRS